MLGIIKNVRRIRIEVIMYIEDLSEIIWNLGDNIGVDWLCSEEKYNMVN